MAALAGLKAGLIEDQEELSANWTNDLTFLPQSDRTNDYLGWQAALKGAFACAAHGVGRGAAALLCALMLACFITAALAEDRTNLSPDAGKSTVSTPLRPAAAPPSGHASSLPADGSGCQRLGNDRRSTSQRNSRTKGGCMHKLVRASKHMAHYMGFPSRNNSDIENALRADAQKEYATQPWKEVESRTPRKLEPAVVP